MHRSLWLQEALDGPPAPALAGAERADVAILGGGFVGLWTALELKRRDPACDVVVLERDVCGGGASGRNGGMVLSWWPKLASLIKLCGVEEALRLGHASAYAIDGIAAFCDEHGIDAQFRRGGFLWTATTPSHVGAWDAVVGLCEQHGIDAFQRLGPDEVARRAGSDRHLAGVFERGRATVQPARLARGLRRVALERGVRIFEQTPATRFTRERPLVVETPGAASARREARGRDQRVGRRLPELRRALVVISSDIVATPPIPDRLAEIGWTGGEGITDSQMMVAYYRTTEDGRIAFGKGTAGVTYGGRVGDLFDRDHARSRETAADFRRNYPALADVPISHDWSAARSTAPRPACRSSATSAAASTCSTASAGAATASGRATSAARSSPALALGDADDGGPDRPPTRPVPARARPLPRRAARPQAVIRKERSELAGREPRRLAVRVAALAPAGLEDKG